MSLRSLPSPVTWLTGFMMMFGCGMLVMSIMHIWREDLAVNICDTTYIYENYERMVLPEDVAIQFPRYDVYRYASRRPSHQKDINALRLQKSVPVLFVPGHLGSYQQMRSSAAESSYELVRRRTMTMKSDKNTKGCDAGESCTWDVWLDWYGAHFAEEPSGLDPSLVSHQATFVEKMIRVLLEKSKSNGVKEPKIILVGFSMGGIVVETALDLFQKEHIKYGNKSDNFGTLNSVVRLRSCMLLVSAKSKFDEKEIGSFSPPSIRCCAGLESIAFVMTLGSPRLCLPKLIPSAVWPMRQKLASQFASLAMSSEFNEEMPIHLHILAGRGDMLVPAISAWSNKNNYKNNIGRPSYHVSIDMENIPGVWCTAMHKRLVSCNQLVRQTVPLLADIAYLETIPGEAVESLEWNSTTLNSNGFGMDKQREVRNEGYLKVRRQLIMERIGRQMSTHASKGLSVNGFAKEIDDGTLNSNEIKFLPCFSGLHSGFSSLETKLSGRMEKSSHFVSASCKKMKIEEGSNSLGIDAADHAYNCFEWSLDFTSFEHSHQGTTGRMSFFVSGLQPVSGFSFYGKLSSQFMNQSYGSSSNGDSADKVALGNSSWIEITHLLSPLPLNLGRGSPLEFNPRLSTDIIDGINWLENATWTLSIPMVQPQAMEKDSGDDLHVHKATKSFKENFMEPRFISIRLVLFFSRSKSYKFTNDYAYKTRSEPAIITDFQKSSTMGGQLSILKLNQTKTLIPVGHPAIQELHIVNPIYYSKMSVTFLNFLGVKYAVQIALARIVLGPQLPFKMEVRAMDIKKYRQPSYNRVKDLETFMEPVFIAIDDQDDYIGFDSVRGGSTQRKHIRTIRDLGEFGLGNASTTDFGNLIESSLWHLHLWHPAIVERRIVLVSDPRFEFMVDIKWDLISWAAYTLRSHVYALPLLVTGFIILQAGRHFRFENVHTKTYKRFDKKDVFTVIYPRALGLILTLVPIISHSSFLLGEAMLSIHRPSVSVMDVFLLLSISFFTFYFIKIFILSVIHTLLLAAAKCIVWIASCGAFVYRKIPGIQGNSWVFNISATLYRVFNQAYSFYSTLLFALLLLLGFVHPGIPVCFSFVELLLCLHRSKRVEYAVLAEEHLKSDISVMNDWSLVYISCLMPCLSWIYSWWASNGWYKPSLMSQEGVMALGIAFHAAWLSYRFRTALEIDYLDNRVSIFMAILSFVSGLLGYSELHFLILFILVLIDSVQSILEH